jgi:ATP-binding cassette, subfamily B, bacterial
MGTPNPIDELLRRGAPDEVEARARETLDEGEELAVSFPVDLEEDGSFADRWLFVTERRVIVVGKEGVRVVLREDLAEVKTRGVVGGGILELVPKEGERVLVPHSSSITPLVGELARVIEQMRTGEKLATSELDRLHCHACGRRLPEVGGVCPFCLDKKTALLRVAAHLGPHKRRVVMLSLAAAFGTAAGLLPPMLTRKLVDGVLLNEDKLSFDARSQLLLLVLLGLLGAQLLGWAGGYVHKRISSWLGARVVMDIRNDLYRQIELAPIKFHDRREVGALMSRISNDAGTLNELLIGGIPDLVLNVLKFVGIFAITLSMNARLTLLVLAPMPAIWFWGGLTRRKMLPWHMRAWLAETKYWAKLAEVLFGIRVVKAFAAEPRETEAFMKRSARVHDLHVQTNAENAKLGTAMGLITSAGGFLLWILGGLEVLDDKMTLGTLLAFQGYVGMLYGPLTWFGEFNGWITKALVGAARIFEILDARAEKYADPDAKALGRLKGRITFEDVTFGYDPSRPVLKGFSLDVAPGEKIGIVGRSGAGKTTIINMLCRFYDPDAGRVMVDGVDLREARLEDLRDQIGIVLQDSFLFSTTIAENIRYAAPDATFTDVMRAAKMANAHPFITRMHDGYDTEAGERGGHLSGGERQRIGIARAIMSDPRLLVLDEATSSLDVNTERQIQEAMRRLRKGRTTFVVAHRLGTVRDADRIVVVEGGRVAEVGSWRELMDKGGIFHEMVTSQEAVEAPLET